MVWTNSAGIADFLHFDDEVERIAGFHSGLTGHIRPRSLGDPSIRLHEEIHDQIFVETADGILHLLLLRWAHRLDAASPLARRLGVISRRLLAQSRFAHECAATYVGIQALPQTAEREATQARLTAEYRRYYDAFGQQLDPCFADPGIRYTLAWGFSIWSFGSDRIERLQHLEDMEQGWFLNEPGPDVRLREVLAAFAALGSEGLVDRVRRATIEALAARDAPAFDPTEPAALAHASPVAEVAVLEAAMALAAALTGGASVSRFTIPGFLRDAADGLTTRFYGMEAVSGRRPAEVPLEVAMHMASQADRWRITRPDLLETDIAPVEAFESTLAAWPTGEQADVYVVTRRRAGKAVHILWVCRHPEEADDHFDHPPFRATDASLAHFANAALAAQALRCLFIVFQLADWEGDDAFSEALAPLSEAFKRCGDVGLIRPFALIGEVTPEPSSIPAAFLLPYARQSFSHHLHGLRGQLVIFRAAFLEDDDPSASNDIYCLFLLPDEPAIMQPFCLISDRDLAFYQSLMAHRLTDGGLTVSSPSVVNAATRRLLAVLWHSLPEL